MATTFTPARSPARSNPSRPTAAARSGYTFAILINALMLWGAHQLLEWEWPRFLTRDFEDVLPWVTASILTTIVANACFLVYDRGWFRPFADMATNVVSLVVGLVMWDVFPFDFSSYESDWSWACRVLIGLGIFGAAVGMVVNMSKFVWRATGHLDKE